MAAAAAAVAAAAADQTDTKNSDRVVLTFQVDQHERTCWVVCACCVVC
jgi:hypothetical protein